MMLRAFYESTGVHHIRLAVSDYHEAANRFAKAGLAGELWAELLGSEFRTFSTAHTLGVDLQFAPGETQESGFAGLNHLSSRPRNQTAAPTPRNSP
jgi:hypothetical protein